MKRHYRYFSGEKDKESNIASMKKYVKEKQEIDKFLEKLIKPYIKSKNLKILDACCGIGHLTNILNDLSPNSEFVGIDQTSYLIKEAKKIFGKKKNLSFRVGDIYNMPKKIYKIF